MKIRIAFAAMACLLSLTLAAAPLEAQKKKKIDPTEKEPVATDPVEDLATAYQLIEYGRKTKSPEALLTAGGIFHRMKPAKELDIKAESSTDDDPKKTKEVASDAMPDFQTEAKKLFAEAKEMSKDDPNVVALADAIANRTSRGATGGPRLYQKTLTGNGHDYFDIPVVPGQPVQLAVVSTGSTTLRVGVKMTAQVKGVTSDVHSGASDGVVGRWQFMAPVANKVTVRVNVRNLSKIPTVYRLATN